MTKTDIKSFPTPAGIIRGMTDVNRKSMLLRMYPEYKHLSSSVHGSPLVSLFKTAFDRSSGYRDNFTDAQRADIFDQQVASLSVMFDFLSVVQSCTEFAPFYRADVDFIGALTESWNVITRGSLLGAIIWNLRSKALLGVL